MPVRASIHPIIILALQVSSVPFCALAEDPAGGQADFFVAEDGDDGWSGRLSRPNQDRTDGPLATLISARDAVRNMPDRESRDISVLVRGGEYCLAQTVVFSRADSAPAGRKTIFGAYPGERPVFTSGMAVEGWQRLTDPVSGVPEAARGKVWVADVLKHGKFYALFDAQGSLPRARGDGFSPTNNTPRGSTEYDLVQFPMGAVKSNSNLNDIELRIVPSHFWIMNLLPVGSIDLATRTIRTSVPGTYPLGRNGMTDRDNAWLENALELLDEPGEWVLDSAQGRLYLWPRTDRPTGIRIPGLTELIRIEGEIDYEGPVDRPVRGLEFRGLAFSHGDCLPWHGRTGWGLQHDWECFDKPTALVRFRGAEDCSIENCEFNDSGHTAVRLDLHCQRIKITGNHIHDIGGVGVLLAGYGPGTKDVNRDNVVANNYIHHIGQQFWGSVAIFAWQSGENQIVHNHISHIPYTGILSTGRISRTPPGPGECSRTIRWQETSDDFRGGDWARREPYLHARNNTIEYNDIHDAMQRLGDGNCIYVSGAGGGTKVRYNYCHDCYGDYMNAVIRCDDDQHQTLMEGNICCRTCGHGEGFISKGDNDIINNVVADLRPSKEGHRGYIVFPYGDIRGSKVERNILYSRGEDQLLYYHSRPSGRQGEPPRLADAEVDGNLYYCTEDPHWADAHLNSQRDAGQELRSQQADPGFADVDNDDFSFPAGSPAAAMGIQPLDAAQAGLEPEFAARLFGRRLHTRIHPPGGRFRQPMNVTIQCSEPAAEIRYALDGSEPDRSSRRYAGPFLLEAAATVRARAFADGGCDPYGDRATFVAPPQPIQEDFESLDAGAIVPGATTAEDSKLKQYQARVTTDQAAAGQKCLKFTDGPGQAQSYTPHVYYRCRYSEGPAVGRFDIRLDQHASFSYQWRQYDAGYIPGPSVTILPGGRLVHGTDQLADLPLDEWIGFEVTSPLGEESNGRFHLTVHLPNEREPKVFKDLEQSSKFRRLDWIGFISKADQQSTYYIDNIQVAGR